MTEKEERDIERRKRRKSQADKIYKVLTYVWSLIHEEGKSIEDLVFYKICKERGVTTLTKSAVKPFVIGNSMPTYEDAVTIRNLLNKSQRESAVKNGWNCNNIRSEEGAIGYLKAAKNYLNANGYECDIDLKKIVITKEEIDI